MGLALAVFEVHQSILILRLPLLVPRVFDFDHHFMFQGLCVFNSNCFPRSWGMSPRGHPPDAPYTTGLHLDSSESLHVDRIEIKGHTLP